MSTQLFFLMKDGNKIFNLYKDVGLLHTVCERWSLWCTYFIYETTQRISMKFGIKESTPNNVRRFNCGS